MTTIACNLKEMAADSMCSAGEVYYLTEGKIVRIGTDLVGSCGSVDSIAKFLDWYEKRGDIPDFGEGDEFESLALTPNGLFMYCNTCRPRKVLDPFLACGSGEQAALAAMHLGKSPKVAVETAIKCDKNSGGPVIVERLKR